MVSYQKTIKYFLVGVFLPTLLFAGYWTHEVVDTTGGSYSSLALDVNGNPHISYVGDDDKLKYAYKTGSVWCFENIDVGLTPVIGTSIALDANEHPHIVFVAGNILFYAYKTGTTWNIDTIETMGEFRHPSLALDSRGNPHVSYFNDGNHYLNYANKSNGVWHVETVDTMARYTGTCIALDVSGNPHISYGSFSGLKYAFKSGSSWQIEIVDEVVSYEGISMVLDVSGNPHISYRGGNRLKYAYKSIDNWYIETVDTVGDVGWCSSIALDVNGAPHISYLDNSNGDLKYAYKSGDFWRVETVYAPGNVGFYTSIALDAFDNPHISYLDATNHDLRYTTTAIWLTYPTGGEVWHPGDTQTIRWAGEGPIDIYFSPDGYNFQLLVSGVSGGAYTITVPDILTNSAAIKIFRDSTPRSQDISGRFAIKYAPVVGKFHSEIVDTAGIVGKFSSLVVDVNGNPHISYYDTTNHDLKYAYKSGQKWYIETVDTAGDAGKWCSLALDENGNPHICYRANYDLKYAYKSAGAWSTEVVRSDQWGRHPQYISLKLDARGDPHVSYYNDGVEAIEYAYKSGGTWHIETAVGWFEDYYYTSLALDGNGNPHISYYRGNYGDLWYTYKSGGNWHEEVIDTTGDVGEWTSLILDRSGNLHISYYDKSNGNLKYAYKTGGSWHIEVVDITGDVGKYTSLTLDLDGNPYISYYDESNGDLKYAYKSGGTWFIEKIDTTNDVGKYTSLKFDANGNLHVSYWDVSNGNLKYTTTAISLFSPKGGETWNVGANVTLKWGGPRDIDVYISLQGGNSWQSLLTGISGTAVGDTWQFSFQVPHIPTHYAKLKIVYENFDQNNPLNYAVSDTFFTIQSTVTLLTFNATPGNNGDVNLRWRTDPGPDELAGYNLYRIDANGNETKVNNNLITGLEYTDHPDGFVIGYVLGAVNGLGEEYRIGEVPFLASDKPIEVFPSLLRKNGYIVFFVPVTASYSAYKHVNLSIVDVSGRTVKKLVNGNLKPGVHLVRINTDNLHEGCYFAVLRTGDGYKKVARFQIIGR